MGVILTRAYFERFRHCHNVLDSSFVTIKDFKTSRKTFEDTNTSGLAFPEFSCTCLPGPISYRKILK